MLKERIATAVVLLAAFLSALFLLPTRQFALLVAGVVGIGAFEWATLVKVSAVARYAFSALCTALFCIWIWGFQAIDPSRPEVAAVHALSAFFWLALVPLWLARGWKLHSRTVALAVGAIVVLPAGLAVVSLHSIAPYALLMVLVLVWLADVAAYFAGRAFGRRKLAPEISPGKTWEGVAGAMVATIFYAIICVMVSPQLSAIVNGGSWVLCFGVAVLLCTVSVLGDLFESMMKRQAGVKDSGTLLPGHGGVLDRIDSVTSTLPTAAFLFFLIAGGP
jgi:phosphatidate cytidylyltransferase